MKVFLKKVTIIFILAIIFCQKSFAKETIIWNSKEGLKRLDSSIYKNDFYQLINYYQPQNNPAYCGVASAVIILNALYSNAEIKSQKPNELQNPEIMGGEILSFHSYSQQSILNDKTDKIKKRQAIEFKEPIAFDNGVEIYDSGLTLSELSKILSKVYNLKVTINYAEENDEEALADFRADLKKYLSDDKNFIVINIDGKILQEETRGHISPIVAYDEISDSVLVLDVALHKTQWYWADVNKLYQAMNSKDGDNFRGYIIVRR